MLLTTYQKCAWETNKTREDHRYFHMQMGFLDESSHICGMVKEARREQDFVHDVDLNRDALLAEIGDSLWYLSALHSVRDIPFGQDMSAPSFGALDNWAAMQLPLPQIDATRALYQSVLVTASALNTEDENTPFPSQQVTQHLMHLARFCHSQGLSLNMAADHNLQKIYGRYAEDISWPKNGFAAMKSLSLDFHYNAQQVTVTTGNEILGDPLTSQVQNDDLFNYHDGLHLAFATYLGWSPVLRKLTGLRRNDVFDGARHVCNEEAIIDDIWTEIRKNPNRSGPGWNMLVEIADKFSEHPEAGKFTYGQWEQAIRKGLDISRQLITNKGGHVTCDFIHKEMRYTPSLS